MEHGRTVEITHTLRVDGILNGLGDSGGIAAAQDLKETKGANGLFERHAARLHLIQGRQVFGCVQILGGFLNGRWRTRVLAWFATAVATAAAVGVFQ